MGRVLKRALLCYVVIKKVPLPYHFNKVILFIYKKQLIDVYLIKLIFKNKSLKYLYITLSL